jgi:aldehyde:ferredoxin oxidoreductase
MSAATLAALVRKLKVVKPKKRCCKSKPRCKKCPVVCKRLMNEGYATRKPNGHYLVELKIGKKALKAARAR